MLKSQTVRLLDVFAIGPLMAYGGWKLKDLPKHKIPGLILAFLGVSTIIYNGVNYLRYQEM
jgi:hypothetical protein